MCSKLKIVGLYNGRFSRVVSGDPHVPVLGFKSYKTISFLLLNIITYVSIFLHNMLILVVHCNVDFGK